MVHLFFCISLVLAVVRKLLSPLLWIHVYIKPPPQTTTMRAQRLVNIQITTKNNILLSPPATMKGTTFMESNLASSIFWIKWALK